MLPGYVGSSEPGGVRDHRHTWHSSHGFEDGDSTRHISIRSVLFCHFLLWIVSNEEEALDGNSHLLLHRAPFFPRSRGNVGRLASLIGMNLRRSWKQVIWEKVLSERISRLIEPFYRFAGSLTVRFSPGLPMFSEKTIGKRRRWGPGE